MTWIIIVAGLIAPAIFWIGYFYYKDRYLPEPPLEAGISYILGFFAAFACIKVFGLLPLLNIPYDPGILMEHNRLLFFFYCIGVVGLLEEFFKLLPFLVVIIHFNAFDEKIDGIIYSSIIALGFATFENINYLVEMSGWQLFGRAFASPLTHTIFASIWGYSIAHAKFSRKSVIKASLKGLLVATLMHGLFDFLTLTPTLRILSALTILVIWIWRIRVIENLNKSAN